MTRPPPRVVLDTNVALSALVFARGRLGRLRLAWQQTLFCPLASNATIAELMRTLAYPKFGLTHAEQQELLGDYLPYCAVVDVPPNVTTPPCRDPMDVPFLQLAVAGRAGYLVSGDKDLNGLRLPRCKIVTPEEFMRALAGDRR